MNEDKNLESFLELTPDMLEQVSGGTMTERAEIVLNALINALKKDTTQEHTPESLIDFVTTKLMDNQNLEGVTAQEVEDYVKAHWN